MNRFGDEELFLNVLGLFNGLSFKLSLFNHDSESYFELGVTLSIFITLDSSLPNSQNFWLILVEKQFLSFPTTIHSGQVLSRIGQRSRTQATQ